MTGSTSPRNKPLTVQQSFDRWWSEHGRDAVGAHLPKAATYLVPAMTIARLVWGSGHRAGVRRARYEGDVRGRVVR